ncbi:hypothetical protein Gohar_017195 [Gossypium harknessii]|uniref:Uncharacterized protein n=1 Tax=Gossypium harknessii TaxID=34285 RepID=A0A7J9G5I5_9ROSI|nr:hypothetical protein [Gossypium harknessii]
MLEVTNPSVEAQLGVDFSHLYKQSHMYPRNKELDNELKVPKQGSKEYVYYTLSTKWMGAIQNMYLETTFVLLEKPSIQLRAHGSDQHNGINVSLHDGHGTEQPSINCSYHNYSANYCVPRKITPTSWTMRGLLTSQYGDINQEIMTSRERKNINALLENCYGFKHNHLPLTALVLIAYPLPALLFSTHHVSNAPSEASAATYLPPFHQNSKGACPPPWLTENSLTITMLPVKKENRG